MKFIKTRIPSFTFGTRQSIIKPSQLQSVAAAEGIEFPKKLEREEMASLLLEHFIDNQNNNQQLAQGFFFFFFSEMF
jgi:hypothetical protein